MDGTGYFSSSKVHCDRCCRTHHRDGRITYYHQLLGAVLVHPAQREVFPLAPEPILKTDGKKKNDCERNAAKRLLKDVRREHPHLKLIVVEDGLASNGPHIELLKQLDMRFILGAKPGDHAYLFQWVEATPATKVVEILDADGVRHRFRYLNGAPLNDANFQLEVNFLAYWELKPNGKQRHFSWVTDLPIDDSNVMDLMRAGRARWRIENETFNTLKNQGYNFEHNFGHGEKHLATVFAYLMMLAFLIDQIQQRCCRLSRPHRRRPGVPGISGNNCGRCSCNGCCRTGTRCTGRSPSGTGGRCRSPWTPAERAPRPSVREAVLQGHHDSQTTRRQPSRRDDSPRRSAHARTARSDRRRERAKRVNGNFCCVDTGLASSVKNEHHTPNGSYPALGPLRSPASKL